MMLEPLTPTQEPGWVLSHDGYHQQPRRAQPHDGRVALRDQIELAQCSAKTQSLQRYSRTCSGDSDTANTETRYCAIGFSRDWDIKWHREATTR
jgi:hypothetical protein